jgi:hypothetical protein
VFSQYINPDRLSRNSAFRKYINMRNYDLDSKHEAKKAFEEVRALIYSVLGVIIKEHIPETKTSNNFTKLTLSVIADVDNRHINTFNDHGLYIYPVLEVVFFTDFFA